MSLVKGSIQHPYRTLASLQAQNPVLLAGQIAFYNDTVGVKLVVGDGVTAFSGLTPLFGAAILFSSAAPLNSVGNNGDICIATSTNQIFQKSLGTWSAQYTFPGGAGTGTVKSFNAITPDGTGNLSITADNVPNGTTNKYYTKALSDVYYLQLTGGTLSGPLVLSSDPTTGLMAATKQYVDAAAMGGLKYQGGYSAASNLPVLPSPATANNGFYWLVSDSGTQFGFNFNAGDWIVSNGSAFEQVNNSGPVKSVFGRLNAVTAQTGDYLTDQVPEGSLNFYYTPARVLNTGLTGLNLSTPGAIGTSDTVLSGFGKLQYQISNLNLSGYAPLASPAFTGNPTAPTQTAGDNSTKLANTAFVSAAIAAIPLPNAIFNQTTLQAGANFNIAGSGTLSALAVQNTGSGAFVNFYTGATPTPSGFISASSASGMTFALQQSATYFRWYNNTSTNTMTLDSSGNLTVGAGISTTGNIFGNGLSLSSLLSGATATFSGAVNGVTPSVGDNSTKFATTAWVNTYVATGAILNQSSVQASSNFNISGNGTAAQFIANNFAPLNSSAAINVNSNGVTFNNYAVSYLSGMDNLGRWSAAEFRSTGTTGGIRAQFGIAGAGNQANAYTGAAQHIISSSSITTGTATQRYQILSIGLTNQISFLGEQYSAGTMLFNANVVAGGGGFTANETGFSSALQVNKVDGKLNWLSSSSSSSAGSVASLNQLFTIDNSGNGTFGGILRTKSVVAATTVITTTYSPVSANEDVIVCSGSGTYQVGLPYYLNSLADGGSAIGKVYEILRDVGATCAVTISVFGGGNLETASGVYATSVTLGASGAAGSRLRYQNTGSSYRLLSSF